MSSYRYRAVDPRIWNDEKFARFDPQQKLLWLALLTHPLMTPMGAGVIPTGVLDEVLGNAPGFCFRCQKACDAHGANTLLAGFAEGYREGIGEGMPEGTREGSLILREGGLIIIKNFLLYNLPNNPNQLCSWLGLCEELPRSREFKTLRDHLFEHLNGRPTWLFLGLLDPLSRQENRGLRAEYWKRIGVPRPAPEHHARKSPRKPSRKPSPEPSPEPSPIPSPEGIGEGSPIPSGIPSPKQDQEQEQEQDQESVKDDVVVRSPKTGDPSPPPATQTDTVRKIHPRPTTHGSGSIVTTIPLVDGTEAPVTDDIIAGWQKLFPGLNIVAQLEQLKMQLQMNPEKKRSAAKIGGFIHNWLKIEQESGKSSSTTRDLAKRERTSAPTPPTRKIDFEDKEIDGKLMRVEFEVESGKRIGIFPHPSTRSKT